MTFHWKPDPINIWIATNPCNELQLSIIQELKHRFEIKKCQFVETPYQSTTLGDYVNLTIGFGSRLREDIPHSIIRGRLPNPIQTVCIITTVEYIPDVDMREFVREQLVRKNGCVGIIIEGDLHKAEIRRVIWASNSGICHILKGNYKDIFDQLVTYLFAHANAKHLHFGILNPNSIKWQQWSNSPIHTEILESVNKLYQNGLFDNLKNLQYYAHNFREKKALAKLDGLEYSVDTLSQLDLSLKVIGITIPNKISVPIDQSVELDYCVPITELTSNGYISPILEDSTICLKKPSDRTHEHGLVYYVSSLVNSGLVDNLESCLNYVQQQFESNISFPIISGEQMPKIKSVIFFHRYPIEETIKDSSQIEIVHPNSEQFPKIGFPSGTNFGAMVLLSALFESASFRTSGDLNHVIVAVIPEHGSVAISNYTLSQLAETLIYGVDWQRIPL
jgi:hypothetical protein